MNKSPLFSIILAGYQTEPYLLKALDSIVSQTFTDFEAICYVEESMDNSFSICERMADHDSRFKVVSAPKSGAGSTTRNYGITHANGVYLVFLDGDDWLEEHLLEELAVKIHSEKSLDVIAFAAARFVIPPDSSAEAYDWKNGVKMSNFQASDMNVVFSGLEAIRRANASGGFFHNYTWLNAYRTEFLREHGIRQMDGMLMEDLESTPRIWFFANRITYIDKIFYAYRKRPGSVTDMASGRLLHDFACQIKSLLLFVDKNKVPEDIQTIWFNQWLVPFFWGMFQPWYSRTLKDSERQKALQILFDGEVGVLFRHAIARTSLPKRLSYPFLLLAVRWALPAKLYFKCFYYPLASLRERLRQ